MNWLARLKTFAARHMLRMGGDQAPPCPECFNRRAFRLGLFVRWVPEVELPVRSEDLVKDFEESFGVGRDVWGTPEAEEYIQSLRRNTTP